MVVKTLDLSGIHKKIQSMLLYCLLVERNFQHGEQRIAFVCMKHEQKSCAAVASFSEVSDCWRMKNEDIS